MKNLPIRGVGRLNKPLIRSVIIGPTFTAIPVATPQLIAISHAMRFKKGLGVRESLYYSIIFHFLLHNKN